MNFSNFLKSIEFCEFSEFFEFFESEFFESEFSESEFHEPVRFMIMKLKPKIFMTAIIIDTTDFNQSTNQSNDQSIDQSANQSSNQSINQSIEITSAKFIYTSKNSSSKIRSKNANQAI